jgi:hypothetical protein
MAEAGERVRAPAARHKRIDFKEYFIKTSKMGWVGG